MTLKTLKEKGQIMNEAIKIRVPGLDLKSTQLIPNRPQIDEERQGGKANVVKTIRYFNYTGAPLDVIDRHGIQTPVDPETSNLGKGFFHPAVFKVTVEYMLAHKLIDRVKMPLVEDAGNILGGEAKLLNEWITQERNNGTGGFTTSPSIIRFEYRIDVDTLRDAGGVLYYEQFDLVIGMRDVGHTTHPFSAMGRLDQSIQALKLAVKGAVLGLRIIDNAGTIGGLYTRLAGRILFIEPERDDRLPDGIHVIARGVTSNNDTELLRYRPDGLDYYSPGDERIRSVLNLWPTYREALLATDEKDIAAQQLRREEETEKHTRLMEQRQIEKEILEIKYNQTVAAAATVEKQIHRDEEKFQREAKADSEKAAAELEIQNQKKKYERDSHAMQTQREWLKFVAPVIGMITVIVSTAAAIIQLRSTTSKLFSFLRFI
jgi:hypothetical protein